MKSPTLEIHRIVAAVSSNENRCFTRDFSTVVVAFASYISSQEIEVISAGAECGHRLSFRRAGVLLEFQEPTGANS